LPDAKYAFTSAYLKGAEAKIVTAEQINRLSRTASAQEVLEAIRDTDVGKYLDEMSIKTFDESDRYLWRYFGDCLERLEWLKPVPTDIRNILHAYIVKYDVLNIKTALQSILTGKQVNMIPVGIIYRNELLDKLSQAEDIGVVIEVLTECKLGAYADILKEYKEEANAKSLTEAKLDSKYYQSLLQIPKGIQDAPLLTKIFSMLVDMANLKLINRAIIEGMGSEVGELIISGGYMISDKLAKDMIAHKLTEIPGALDSAQYRNIADEVVASYNRTKSITAVEEVIDKHQFQLLREMLSPRVMTPLMIVWYLIVKELEVRNLRLVLKAAFDNIAMEEIKDYLVFS